MAVAQRCVTLIVLFLFEIPTQDTFKIKCHGVQDVDELIVKDLQYFEACKLVIGRSN